MSAPAVRGRLMLPHRSADQAEWLAALDQWCDRPIEPLQWKATSHQLEPPKESADLSELFAAIRVSFASAVPSLCVAEEANESVPLGFVDVSRERYQGKRGKLVVLKRK